MIRAGAIVPHAPLLVEGVTGDGSDRLASVRRAVGAALPREGGAPVVVLSSHGGMTGVYRNVAGDLDSFGVRGVATSAPTEEPLVGALAEAWGEPVLDRPADFGVVVPLLLGVAGTRRVVAATIAEGTTPEAAVEVGEGFARALATVAGGGDLVFVASAHTSSALSARAPLGHRPEAEAAAHEFVSSLQTGKGLAPAAGRLAHDGYSCGAAPLIAFADILESTRCEVLADESPFGVGYLVVRAQP